MSRLMRLRVTDRIFYVTVKVRKGVPLFREGDFLMILESFGDSRRQLGFELCGYVLMPDHWHALVFPHAPLTVSRLIQDVKYRSARKLNRARGAKGTVWQHQFWDRFVRNAREFAARLEYMHLNPVRRSLVKDPQEWPWSSYRNFALEKSVVASCPIQIDYLSLTEQYRA